MPLSANTVYDNTARLKNLNENWLFEFDNSSSGTLRLAFADCYVGGNLYRGMVLGEPSIRSSIDLVKSRLSISNFSIEVANGKIAGANLSELLLFASVKYVNWPVRVYSQLTGNETLANCKQIFTGRLVNVSHGVDTISLDVEEARPWDFIKFPQTRTTNRNRLFPVVYGDFTANASVPSTRAFCTSLALYPVQVDQRGPEKMVALMPRSYSSGAWLHIYEETTDSFVALVDSSEAIVDATFTSVGGNCISADAGLYHGWFMKGTEAGSGDGATVTFANPRNVFDVPHANDTSASSATDTLNVTSVAGDTGDMFVGIARPKHTIKAGSTMTATVYWEATKTGAGTPAGSPSSNITLSAPFGVSGTAGSAILNWGAGVQSVSGSWTPSGDIPAYLKIHCSVNNTGGTGNAAIAIQIWDVTISYETELDLTDDPQAVASASNDVKWLYCGANGLQDFDRSGAGTDYWINGNSTPSDVTEVHQMHRDLVHRFTSYQGDPTGWSDLDTARDGWTVRWWTHEQVSLLETLEKLQFEGGFVFTWSPDGTARYIFVKSSYSSGDVTYTLSERDIAGLKVSHTPFGDMVTSKSIQYNKHPATGDFQNTESYVNATARTAYNIQTAENIENVELDMLVANVDDHASHYGRINGTIKCLLDFSIVNPLYWGVTVGDILQFTSTRMPVKTFATDWTQYFMVTSVQRRRGVLQVSAREVG